MADDAESQDLTLSTRFVDEREYIAKFLSQIRQEDVAGRIALPGFP